MISNHFKYSYLKLFTIILLFSKIKNANISFLEKEKKPFKTIYNIKNRIRNLLEESKVNEVCSRAKSEVKEFFEQGNVKLAEMDYENDSGYIDDLLNIIDGKGEKSKNDSIKSYIKRVIPMLFFIAFGIVAIILWPISLCCLCCCKCCCCFCCCGVVNKLWKTIFFFVSGGAFVLTFIMATYGLAATNNVFKSLDSTSCSLFKVVTETVNGESKTSLPKWAGIDNVKIILATLSSTISNAQSGWITDFNNAKLGMDNAKSSFTEVVTKSNSEIYGTHSTGTDLTGPNGGTSYTDVIPGYVVTYPSVLQNVKTEYTTLTEGIYQSLEESKEYINDAFDGNELSEQLGEASENIVTLQENFNTISEKVAEPWMDNQNSIVNNGKKYAKIVFSIIMVLSLGMTGIYIINYIDKCSAIQCLLKIVTIVVWNLLYLFSILSYIVSGLIGVIGIIGRDSSSLAYFLISEKNLNNEKPRLFEAGESIDFLNICVNGNGNLKEKLNLGNTMDQLNKLYALSDTLNNHIAAISDYKSSEVLKNTFPSSTFNYDTRFLDCDYYKYNTNNKYNFIEWFDELNKYTSKVTGNKQLTTSGNTVYDDHWGITNTYNEYKYFGPPSSVQADSTKKNLLNLYDGWTSSEVLSRYSIDGATTDSNKVSVKASQIIGEFANMKTQMTSNYFTPTKNYNNNINDKFKTVSEETTKTLKSATKIIDSIGDIIGDYLGDGDNSIYALINCKFIGADFRFLIKQLHYSVGKDVYSFASTMISMTVFLSIALYSSIFYMVLVKKVHDSNEEKK